MFICERKNWLSCLFCFVLSLLICNFCSVLYGKITGQRKYWMKWHSFAPVSAIKCLAAQQTAASYVNPSVDQTFSMHFIVNDSSNRKPIFLFICNFCKIALDSQTLQTILIFFKRIYIYWYHITFFFNEKLPCLSQMLRNMR